MAAVFSSLGNRIANTVLESHLSPCSPPKPTPSSSRKEREVYIRCKYEERRFLSPPSHLPCPHLPSSLCAAAREDDLAALLTLILQSDDLGERGEAGLAPLLCAAMVEKPLCCELLLLAGGSIEVEDERGQTALHVAAANGAGKCLALLLRRLWDGSGWERGGRGRDGRKQSGLEGREVKGGERRGGGGGKLDRWSLVGSSGGGVFPTGTIPLLVPSLYWRCPPTCTDLIPGAFHARIPHST